MWKVLGVVLAYVWVLCAGYLLVYYGSFVLRVPDNPLGNEAQLGAFLGFIYSIPAWAILGAAALHVRKTKRGLALFLAAPAVVGICYFVAVYAAVWRAGAA